MKKLDWFKARIGKVIYRSNVTCKCGICLKVRLNGILIADENHAEYLYEVQKHYKGDPKEVDHFDTKEEVLEYEAN